MQKRSQEQRSLQTSNVYIKPIKPDTEAFSKKQIYKNVKATFGSLSIFMGRSKEMVEDICRGREGCKQTDIQGEKV